MPAWPSVLYSALLSTMKLPSHCSGPRIHWRSRKKSKSCTTKSCLPCERIEWGMISNNRQRAQIHQDDAIHGVNDVFCDSSGYCKPQVTFEGNLPNKVTGTSDCHAKIQLPRAHKGVGWGSVKGKLPPGKATYFHLENYNAYGSARCIPEEGRTCRW